MSGQFRTRKRAEVRCWISIRLSPVAALRCHALVRMELAQGHLSRLGECASLAMTADLAWKEHMANMGGWPIRSCNYRP